MGLKIPVTLDNFHDMCSPFNEDLENINFDISKKLKYMAYIEVEYSSRNL
jgi:hypothetical protein